MNQEDDKIPLMVVMPGVHSLPEHESYFLLVSIDKQRAMIALEIVTHGRQTRLSLQSEHLLHQMKRSEALGRGNFNCLGVWDLGEQCICKCLFHFVHSERSSEGIFKQRILGGPTRKPRHAIIFRMHYGV